METKRCPRCRKEKSTDEFTIARGRSDGLAVYCRPCSTEFNRERNHRLRMEAMDLLGGRVCKRCGFDDVRALTIDHKNGGGTQHRRDAGSGWGVLQHVLKFPEQYQVLCWNCNYIKRVESGENSSRSYREQVLAVPRERVTKRVKRWSKDYDECQGCGTTDQACKADGLCHRCYMRRWRKAKAERIASTG